MYLELSDNLSRQLPETTDLFGWFLHGEGTVHREIKNRLTYETRLGDVHFFVKRHLGCGWKEVFKDWHRLRKPVVSARTEWEGAEALAAAGVPVPQVLGKGERGRWPHAVESFVVLEALEDCETLEHFKHGWSGFTDRQWIALKIALITEVAEMTRRMHGAGLNHRDLYLNHFLINRTHLREWTPGKPPKLHLIDLHRVQKRTTVPTRWQVKDLGSLLFSAMDVGLTSTDIGRFLRVYLGDDWKFSVRQNPKIWQTVVKRATRNYRKFHGKPPKAKTLKLLNL